MLQSQTPPLILRGAFQPRWKSGPLIFAKSKPCPMGPYFAALPFVCSWPIVLQKSLKSERRFSRLKPTQAKVATKSDSGPITEVTDELSARSCDPPHPYTKNAPTALKISDQRCKWTFATVSARSRLMHCNISKIKKDRFAGSLSKTPSGVLIGRSGALLRPAISKEAETNGHGCYQAGVEINGLVGAVFAVEGLTQ